MNFPKTTPQSFISDNFLHTQGDHGRIDKFIEEGVDTLRIQDKGLIKITSLTHLTKHKNQILGITKDSEGFLLLIYTGKTSDIVSNMETLQEIHTKKVVSLDNLRESLTFMAEFMPGFYNTLDMKKDTLEKHLSEYFDIKISNDSTETFVLLKRPYPSEVSHLLAQTGTQKNQKQVLV